MKKFLALVLALTMLMGMSVNVFAWNCTQSGLYSDHVLVDEGWTPERPGDRLLDGQYHYNYCLHSGTDSGEECEYYVSDEHEFSTWEQGGSCSTRSCEVCSYPDTCYHDESTSKEKCSICGADLTEKLVECDEPKHGAMEYAFEKDGKHYVYCTEEEGSMNLAYHGYNTRGYKSVHEPNYTKLYSYNSVCYYGCEICGITDEKFVTLHEGKTYCSVCGWGTAPETKPVKVEKYEEPATPAAEIKAAEEEAMVVNVVTNDKSQVAKDNESVIPGTAYNMSAFVTTKGFVAGLNKVIKANAKETTVSIYTKNPFAFSKSLVKAINDGKKDVVYYFTHAGHVYSVTIPAGTDANTILEKNGFAGPLYVGKVLGTTTLVK